MKKETISVFGLGKLGCTMLACFAHKGWRTIGVDVNPDTVEKVSAGVSPIYEPGVDKLIKDNTKRITATTDAMQAIIDSEISFVIVPTPSIRDGSFSTKYVETVAAEIGSMLRAKDDYHLVVITSTVLPGNMSDIVQFLERTSGRQCGSDFGVCYNPDFIALGSVVHDLLNPDMVLIGESDERSGALLAKIHEQLTDNNPTIHRMNFHNAELAKIALNSYCTLKITFANQLAEICEHMPGGNVDLVTAAIGDDSRIGRKYFKGGLSYGGPCFPRDNRAFGFAASKYGCKAPLALLTDELNNYQKSTRVPGLLLRLLDERNINKLAILGLTYKENTHVAEESAPIAIIKALSERGIAITVFDPAGMEEAREELCGVKNVEYAGSATECIQGHELCFIATPWREFRDMSKETFVEFMKTPTVLDSWNLYSFTRQDTVEYFRLGTEMT